MIDPPDRIEIALLDRRTDNKPRPVALSREELAELLSRHDSRAKKDGPAFSPTIYAKGKTRRNENVQALTLAVGDFDGGTSPETVRDHLSRLGVWFVIYSTHSSTPKLPRFRAVVPLLEPVPADRWGTTWPALVRELFLGKVDLGTRDTSRIFYLPSAPPGATPFIYRGDGTAFDASKLRLDPEQRRRPLTLPGETGPILTGERHPKLMSIAGRLRNAGGGYDAILAELRVNNEKRCDPKLSEKDLEHIAASACQYEPGPTKPPKPTGPAPPLEEFDFRPGGRIRQTEEGVFWVVLGHDKKGAETEADYIVITDRVTGHRRIAVEGQVYIEAELLPGQRVTSTVPALLARLDAMGRVLDHGRARDVLPALLHHVLRHTEESHPTWGFYPGADGRIVECRRPTPIRPEQDARWLAMGPAVGREISEEDLRAYVALLRFYRPYESFPVLGSAVAAPLAFVARSQRELVCHVLAYSKTSGLGKTSLAEAFSDDLFGVRPATGPSLNAEFRWAAHLDSACAPMAVNEAQGLSWKVIAPAFKASAESMVADRRGRPDQTMDEYMSRLVALMTSNAAPPLTPTELVRLVLVHMDESAKREREGARARFEAAAEAVRGRSIGPALARLITREYPTVESFMRRRSKLAGALTSEARAQDFSFGDGRRPGAWAHIYLGLEAFARACRENGVEWSLPTPAEFLRDIVIPIERGAAEVEVTALQSFRLFAANYRVEHTVRQIETTEGGQIVDSRDSVKGEGSIIFTDAFDLSEGREGATPKKIPGDWITAPFLDRFNVECDRRSRPELRFASLKELSERAALEAGLPREAFLEFSKTRGEWEVRRVSFPDGGRPRAAFVPAVEGQIEGIIENAGDLAPPRSNQSVSGNAVSNEFSHSTDEESSGHKDPEVCPVVSGGVQLCPVVSGCVRGVSGEISDVKSPLRSPGHTDHPSGPNGTNRAPGQLEREAAPNPGRVSGAVGSLRAYLSDHSSGADGQAIIDHLSSLGFSEIESNAALGRIAGDGTVVHRGDLFVLKREGS